jgi:IS5 family transposase
MVKPLTICWTMFGAGTTVLADKAYDAARIQALLREKEVFANIPLKANEAVKTLLQHSCIAS